MSDILDSLFFPEDVFEVTSDDDSRGLPSNTDLDSFDRATEEDLEPPTLKRLRGDGVNGLVEASDEEDEEDNEEEAYSPPRREKKGRGGRSKLDRKESNKLRAREARKRKQQHMASLHAELASLKAANQWLESQVQKASAAHLDPHASTHRQWFDVVRSVLALRATGMDQESQGLSQSQGPQGAAAGKKEAWLRFVDPGFVLCHPITPYRSYKRADVLHHRVVLTGVDDALGDAVSLQVALSALCREALHVGRDPDKKEGPNHGTGTGSSIGSIGSSEGGNRVVGGVGYGGCGGGLALSKRRRRLHDPTKCVSGGAVELKYTINFQEACFGPEGLMCPFEMRSVNLVSLGLLSEVVKQGSLRALFVDTPPSSAPQPQPLPPTASASFQNPLHVSTTPSPTSVTTYKLKQLDLYFDPIAFWRQMQAARGVAVDHPFSPLPSETTTTTTTTLAAPGGSGGGLRIGGNSVGVVVSNPLLSSVPSSVVPNTYEAALRPSPEARVVTEARHPFYITHVNAAWECLCGYGAHEVVGKTLGFLQGPGTDLEAVSALVEDCNCGRPSSMEVTNYDKQGFKLRNFLQTFPLSGGDQFNTGVITHILGVLQPLLEIH
mmetsp:Transcript_87312/g.174697  ORF Transcript_87312/g.174697 Transcript_87312/m.174697 type:complete len:607 (-) Transcript_87312:191-2011(-)